MRKRICAGKEFIVPCFSLLAFLLIISGCRAPSGLSGGPYHLDDDRLQPFAAMYSIDRKSFCLTEIDPTSEVYIERDSRRSKGYDMMLHIYSDSVHRTVAFVREDEQYVWIGEQEIHYGGQTFETPDGEIREYIVVTYHEREYGVGGVTGLTILYIGVDESIPTILTCEQASSYIGEWDAEALDSQ